MHCLDTTRCSMKLSSMKGNLNTMLAMTTHQRTSTTKMEVTSIRLEPELKEKLRELAGDMGYQSLIREILWQYVRQHSHEGATKVSLADIRAHFAATAQKEEHCAITGNRILPQQPMFLGWTTTGELVPLCKESLAC